MNRFLFVATLLPALYVAGFLHGRGQDVERRRAERRMPVRALSVTSQSSSPSSSESRVVEVAAAPAARPLETPLVTVEWNPARYEFERWYAVYRVWLDLPEPPLLIALADLWSVRLAERARIELRSGALSAEQYNSARDAVDRRLRAALKRLLHPLDWNRIRHSGTWRSLIYGLD